MKDWHLQPKNVIPYMNVNKERNIEKGKLSVRIGPIHRIGCMAVNPTWFTGKTKGSQLLFGVASCQHENVN